MIDDDRNQEEAGNEEQAQYTDSHQEQSGEIAQPKRSFKIEPKSINNVSDTSHKDELFKAGTPDPNMIVNNIKIDLARKKSMGASRKEKMSVIDEVLIISVSEVNRLKCKNSPSSGLVSYSPKLSFSYPTSELTYADGYQ